MAIHSDWAIPKVMERETGFHQATVKAKGSLLDLVKVKHWDLVMVTPRLPVVGLAIPKDLATALETHLDSAMGWDLEKAKATATGLVMAKAESHSIRSHPRLWRQDNYSEAEMRQSEIQTTAPQLIVEAEKSRRLQTNRSIRHSLRITERDRFHQSNGDR